MIPGWYGAGAGLRAALAECGLQQVRDAYSNWYFLRNLIDDIETMLARTDLQIAQAYDELAPVELRRFFPRMCSEYALACEQVLAVKAATIHPAAQSLRGPYEPDAGGSFATLAL
jgi:phosphoenolpyruvate carboxylase